VGIYVRSDAGVVYHKADNTETVLGSGGGGAGTFATTYTNTPSDNLVTENVTGGELTLKYDGIGTAQTSGLTVKSTTAATSGNQKNSPMIEQCGAGYGTVGSASQSVCAGWQLTPTQASNASADVSLYQQNGGGSLTQSLKIASGLTNSTFVSATTVIGQDESTSGAIAFNTDGSGSVGFWSGVSTFRGDAYPMAWITPLGLRPGLDNGRALGTADHQWSDAWSYVYATKKGGDIDSTGSNVTVAITSSMHHVTNAGSIQTITPPSLNGGSFVGCVDLIPDGAFTTVTGGNIAKASTAVVSKALRECFDGTSWYPSY
jgi:hypothetical protein